MSKSSTLSLQTGKLYRSRSVTPSSLYLLPAAVSLAVLLSACGGGQTAQAPKAPANAPNAQTAQAAQATQAATGDGASVPTTSTGAATTAAAAGDASAPPLADVQGALARVYHDNVTLDAGRAVSFVVGDFNGDDSQDLAVVVTPAKDKLPKINSEYASWILEDPQKVVLPEVRGDVQVLPKKPAPVAAQPGDVMLAVIHGYQKEGWRNSMASQTFLLKNGVGEDLKPQRAAQVLSTKPPKSKLPPLRGDVIRETLSGRKGFLYWTGAKYAWFEPQEQQPNP